jgi:insertion element IS1 protein InsB
LRLECDELWSFKGCKKVHVWLWVARDRDTRESVGVAIGDRDQAPAQQLWDWLPAVYRQCALASSDFWHAYRAVLPTKRHQAVGKHSGQTNHVERLNTTFRQRVGRLARKSWAFSKRLTNHIGAIWHVIHQVNASPLRGRA